jgi:hypothetical protein
MGNTGERGPLNAHEHRWTLRAHVDYCHFFTWDYLCACGASLTTEDERDFAKGWLGTGDFPDPENCRRCRELSDGAARKTSIRTLTEAR